MIKNKIKEKKATSTLEFLVMLSIIIILLGYFFTGTQIIINKIVINYATQLAAREACVMDNYNDAKYQADKKAKEVLKSIGLGIDSIETSCSSNGWQKGNKVEVKVKIKYTTLFPIINKKGVFSTENQSMTDKMKIMIENIT